VPPEQNGLPVFPAKPEFQSAKIFIASFLAHFKCLSAIGDYDVDYKLLKLAKQVPPAGCLAIG
jgi:hypothetical protein